MGRGSLTGRRGVRLAYVHSFADRTGRVRHYFRRNGRRTPLPGAFGSRDFLEAYAALLGEEQPKPAQRPEPGDRSFHALAARYFGAPQFHQLSPASRKNYRRVIEGFVAEHGARRVDQLTRERVDILLGRMADRPGAGIIFLKRLRTLVHYAMALGWIATDPTAKVQSYRSTEIHTWTEDEIAAFEAHWPSGTKQRLAFALLLYTGQRGSDVHRMVWADIAGEAIHVAQQKTGERLMIPLHPSLRRELAAARAAQHATGAAHLAILTTAFGQPFTVKGFGQMVSAAIRAAALPARCKAHGLRKAAARRLAEAGCSAKQIAAVTGHKTLAETERYTRAADQKLLARQAIEKQAENEGLANPFQKFATPPAKR
jgi:integrase